MKAPLRDRSLGTKLTEEEHARVEAAALRAGVGLSEWCRRVVLSAIETDTPDAPTLVMLAEVLALRAVLLNVMFRIANGEALTQQDMRQLIDRADKDKHARAAAVVADSRGDRHRE